MTLGLSRQRITFHSLTRDIPFYNTLLLCPYIREDRLEIFNQDHEHLDGSFAVDVTEETLKPEEENTSSEPAIEDNAAALPEQAPSEDALLASAATSKDANRCDGELSDLEPDSFSQT